MIDTAAAKFAEGQAVETGHNPPYRGVVVCEYLPGMYEVRLGSGVVVKPASELRPVRAAA